MIEHSSEHQALAFADETPQLCGEQALASMPDQIVIDIPRLAVSCLRVIAGVSLGICRRRCSPQYR